MTGEELVIDITTENPIWNTAIKEVEMVTRRAIQAAWDDAKSVGNESEVSIVLGDDAMIRELNRTYRHQDKATNVLSFPAGDEDLPAGAPTLLGDIVLAYETIVREATEQEKTLPDHLSHLCVHGLLHLLGYDHETDVEAAEMESLEVAIVAKLGIADPFAMPATEV